MVEIPVSLVYVRSLEYKCLRLNSIIINDFNSKDKHFEFIELISYIQILFALNH